MNQILVSERMYVTPEIKKKRKLFKGTFLISVFLVCILSSYGIYAEYDRNRTADLSREILANIEFTEPTMQVRTVVDEPIIVILNSNRRAIQTVIEQEIEVVVRPEVSIARDGTEYYAIGTINIPSINVNYPILSVTTDELLRKSPTRFWGPNPNEPGNLSIAAHNYRNSRFFSRVPRLEIGDIIEITDLTRKNTYICRIWKRYCASI